MQEQRGHATRNLRQGTPAGSTGCLLSWLCGIFVRVHLRRGDVHTEKT